MIRGRPYRKSLGRWLRYRSPYGAELDSLVPFVMFFGSIIALWFVALLAPYGWLTFASLFAGPALAFILVGHYYCAFRLALAVKRRQSRAWFRAWGRDMRARDEARRARQEARWAAGNETMEVGRG